MVTLTTADGRGADSFVRGGGAIDPGSGLEFKNTNYGGLELAMVKFNRKGQSTGSLVNDFNNSFTRSAFFRFDLSGIGGTITAAMLTLGVRATELGRAIPVSFSTILDGHAQDAAPADGGWDEFALTMSNSGILTGAVPLLDPFNTGSFTVPGTTGPTTGATVQVSHAKLLAGLNADTNGLVTIVLDGAPVFSGLGVNFWTKENTAGGFIPTLQLTVEADERTVPAPAALSLFVLGLGLVGVARRRRTA